MKYFPPCTMSGQSQAFHSLQGLQILPPYNDSTGLTGPVLTVLRDHFVRQSEQRNFFFSIKVQKGTHVAVSWHVGFTIAILQIPAKPMAWLQVMCPTGMSFLFDSHMFVTAMSMTVSRILSRTFDIGVAWQAKHKLWLGPTLHKLFFHQLFVSESKFINIGNTTFTC